MPIKYYSEQEAKQTFNVSRTTEVGDIVYIKRYGVYGLITDHEYVRGIGETTPQVLVRFKPFDKVGTRLTFNGYTHESDCENACLYIDKQIESAENKISQLNTLKEQIINKEIMKG